MSDSPDNGVTIETLRNDLRFHGWKATPWRLGRAAGLLDYRGPCPYTYRTSVLVYLRGKESGRIERIEAARRARILANTAAVSP